MSDVDFPHQSLEKALEVAEAIALSPTRSISSNDLALRMHSTNSSGAFRMKLSAARKFGLVSRGGKLVSLTELGQRATSTKGRQAALVEAFRRVSLYGQLHDMYADTSLPGPKELERRMLSLGVNPRSVSRARQAFIRSAVFAGILSQDQTHFLSPPSGMIGGLELKSARDDPILIALWDRRPYDGCTVEQLEKWMDMLRRAFDFAYTFEGSSESLWEREFKERPRSEAMERALYHAPTSEFSEVAEPTGAPPKEL